MQGSDILNLLNQCITPDGKLVLDASQNPLGSPSIDSLLEGVFSGVLTAVPGAAQVGQTSVTYPDACLECETFLYYKRAEYVASVITVSTGADQQLELSVTARMPANWTLVDSFPAIGSLPYSALQRILAAAAVFTVNSALSPTESQLAVQLTVPGSVLSQVEWLIGDSVAVSGPARFVAGENAIDYPQFTLRSAPAESASLSGFECSVRVILSSIPGTPVGSDGRLPLDTTVGLALDLSATGLTLPLLISLSSADQAQYTMSLNPDEPAPSITVLDQLDGFAWGQDVSAPLGNTPIGVNLSIPSFSMLFDASKGSFSFFTIAVYLDTGWTIADNLELKGLQAELCVPVVWGGQPPDDGATAFSISVTALFQIGGAGINATILYPEQIVSLALAPYTEIDINAFLDALSPGVTLPGSGDLSIVDLTISADIPESSYSVGATASGALEIIPNFVLTDLGFTIAWAGSAVDSFQFTAGFTIAGVAMYMNVVYGGSNWTVGGYTSATTAILLSSSDPDTPSLASSIASIFGVQLPPLPSFVLAPVGMEYQTADGTFDFDATVTGCFGDDPVLTRITGTSKIHYDGTAKVWTGSVTGSIVLDETNQFDVVYDFHDEQVVSLSWTSTGSPIGINDLCQLFGAPNMQQMIPPDLDLALTQVIGKYNITTQMALFECRSENWGNSDIAVWRDAETNGWRIYFGVDIPVSISLTDLPLIGKSLSGIAEVALREVEAAISNSPLTEEEAAAVTSQIDAGYPTPPAQGLPAGGGLAMVFDANGKTTRISVGMTDDSGDPPPPSPSTGPDVPNSPGGEEVSTSTDGTSWFSLQQSYGPVTVQKVGVRYRDNKLWALMNATINAGGLNLELLGLGVGSPLTTFKPAYTVDGITVTLTEGPVAFSGSLVGALEPVDLYGQFSAVIGKYTIGAIAGYAEYQDNPSFFLYGVLNGALGGPPFFFVNGISLGFGFNRSLIVPDVSGVADFPLVQWAAGLNAPAADPSADIGRQVAAAMDSLAASGAVAPNIGESWCAAGVNFTSFEMVESFALAVFNFGDDFQVNLIGLSTLAVPPAPSAPVAEAQVALKATIRPSSGMVGITGQLTPNSYAFSRDAKLTGGFAYFMWLSGEHAGEFVMTLGGYNPKFRVPDYYPQVGRLGLKWQVDSCLSITGSLYFALTSSAVMAGGSLSAVWKSGPIRAWFDVEADFLMMFTPFQYYMSGSVDVGASVRIKLAFTHVTLSAHIGVGFELWGPEFSGRVKVDMTIVSFTIRFGAGNKSGPDSITWSDFVQQLLPSQTSAPALSTYRRSLMARKRARLASGEASLPPAVLQITGLAGVLQTVSDVEGELNWLVDSQTFQAQVQTSIPLKTYTLDGPGVVLAEKQPDSPPNTNFGCGPVNISPADFSSHLEVSLAARENSVFDAVMVLSAIPKALWEQRAMKNGVPQNVDPVNATTIDNCLTAFTLIPTVTPPDRTPLPIPLENLQYTLDPKIQSFAWSRPVVQTTDPFTPDETVASTIAAEPASSNRPSLLAAIQRAGLNVYQTADVSTLSSAESNYLLAQPVLCYLGESKA